MKGSTAAVVIVIGGSLAFAGYHLWIKKSAPGNKKGLCEGSFLAIGDSFTEFNPAYADQLKGMCPQLNVRKIAKSGMKTDWVLKNFKAESGKYDILSVFAGMNDIYAGTSLADTKKNLEEIYKLGKANGAFIIGSTIPHTKGYKYWNDGISKKTKELNQWIRENKEIDLLIDLEHLANDNTGALKPEIVASDKLHFNRAGHKLVAEEIHKRLTA